MCKFSTSLAPPEAPAGLEQLLEEQELAGDDFNWFDAIDAIDDADLGLEGAAQQQASSSEAEQRATPDGTTAVASSAAQGARPAASGSDNSSYDLVEMFKQQVEQQQQQQRSALQHAASSVPQAGFGGPAASFTGPFGATVMQQPLMCGMGAAAFAMAPQMLAGAGAPLTPSSAFLPPPAAAMMPAMQFDAGAVVAAAAADEAADGGAAAADGGSAGGAPACGRRSRASKTQEEIDAAVERIKQKRRESAQRSRARKNDYMRQLELENQALKDEVQRLQQVLAAMQRTAYQHPHAALMPLGAL